MEQMIRLLHDCGLPAEDVDFVNSDGVTMNKILTEVSLLLWKWSIFDRPTYWKVCVWEFYFQYHLESLKYILRSGETTYDSLHW